jgi:hypothetical protein
VEITKQELLELITQDDHPEMDLDWNTLTQLYTHQLASISPKLSQQELASMVTIGIALYQKGYKEYEAAERAKLNK